MTTNTMSPQTPRQHYVRLLTISLGCALTLTILGYAPTVRLAGESSIASMLLGIGTSLLASALGAIPVCKCVANDPTRAPIAILGATAIRFLVVLLLVAVAVLGSLVQPVVFVTWVAASYLTLLLADTLAAVRVLKTVSGGTPQ